MIEESQGQGSASLPVPQEAVRQPIPAPVAPTENRPPLNSSAPEPSGNLMADVEKRLTFAEQTHQYIRDYIRQADQKAGFFFTASTALLAFLYRSNVSSQWIKPLLQWNVLDTAGFLSMVSLAAAALTCLFVVVPRTSGSRRGYLFWEAIAEYDSGRQYSDDLGSISLPTLLQVKAEHCHDLARVCRRKYKVLRVAFWISMVGLAASLIVFLFAQPVTLASP